MTKINVEDQKKAVFELNGLDPFDEEMTFYYDESGNCRKFSLTEVGFNSIDSLKGDFVLAGVAHEGKSYDMGHGQYLHEYSAEYAAKFIEYLEA